MAPRKDPKYLRRASYSTAQVGEQGIESPISCALHEPMVITFRLCIYAIAQLSNGVFEEYIEIRKAQLGLRPSVVLVG
jgi:hypothetical protein